MGKVNDNAKIRNPHEAINLPVIDCHGLIGIVKSNSKVPKRRYSDQRRMPTAGTKNRYNHGCHMKNGCKFA